jgi:hypothetical protein
MALGPAILKILSKQYEPSSFVEKRFQRYDLGFKTDADGNPIVLFMAQKMPLDIFVAGGMPADCLKMQMVK